MTAETSSERLVCTACAIYAVFYLMSGFVHLLTLTLTMPVYVFFNKNKSAKTGTPNNPIVAFVVDVVAGVVQSVSGFLVQIVVMVVRTVYLLLPVLVFIVLMSILNANLDTAMPIMVMAYNRFVVETNAISMIRKMAWIFRITFEIFTPLYNWTIETIANSYADILRLLVDNDRNRSQITTIVQEIGTLFVTLTRTVVSWMLVNFNECSQKTIVQDLIEMQLNPTRTTGLQHRCFDFDYLDLDLAPAVMVGQKIATTAHSLSTSLCPSLASISALVLYPLYDRHMSRIVQNTLNLMLGVYYTGQVTHTRCRAAFALSLSTTLCTPDLYPMFRYVERITESAGLMVDNWLNIAHMMLLSFFMDRDADIVDRCRANGHNVDTLLTDAMFADRATRLLSCTSSLLAATDGNSVVYTSKNTNQPAVRVQDAFTDSVDVTNGIAAIDFAGSLLETDDNGDTRTGILGCKCIDGEEGGHGVSIVCNVALFPAFFDPAHRLQVAQTQIPLLFERGTTGRLLTCRYLRISVQSVRFPAQVFDVSKQSSTGAASYNHDIYSECMADPRKCNTIDAAVYVMPLCPMYSALENMDAAAEPTECIRDSKYQTCFPYCVALHQKGAGNTPMTLHNKRSLADGVYMAKTRVAMPINRIVPPSDPATLDAPSSLSTSPVTSTCLVSSEFQRIADLTATYCTIQSSNTAGAESFSASDLTIRSLAADSCTDSNTACVDDASSGTTMTFLQRATVLHASQPFIFAGDIILVQVCELDGTVCQLSTSLFRLTSDIHSQYSIINRMSSIPSIRTSDASKPSEHGGIIIPGESNDVIMKRSPAAQTRTGIVYGVNPNPLPFRCLLRGCVLWTKITGCTEIACINCYQKPQVFFTQPMYKCRGGRFDTVRDANAQNVRTCQYDTTTEIKFENNDRFWSVEDDCQQVNSGSPVNLYIEDIVYIDDLNVVISVRRGPVEELLWLVGLNSTAWPADRPMRSRTLHYFLNMETKQIRANAQWTHSTSDVSNGQYSILCQTDNMVPMLGTFAASTFNVGLKMTSIVLNSYVLNLYGIMEGMVSETPLCRGRGLNHYALDNCNSLPLSMRPVYEQLVKVHRQLDQVLAKMVAYLGVVFGIEQSTQRLAYNSLLAFALGPLARSNAYLDTLKIGGDAEYMERIAESFESIAENGVTGVGAFVGGTVQAVFASMHGMFYLYDEIFLKYVVTLIRNKNFSGKYELDASFFALSNRVFDSIATGAMKTTLVAPQYRVCQTYSQLTANTQSALGKTVFHSCVAVIEVFYAAMQIVSSTITLSAVSDCICNINPNERELVDRYEERCRYKMPETLHPRLVEFMVVRDRRASVSVCSLLVNNFKNVLLKIPTEAKMHINLALSHAVDVPVEMMNFMKIDGLQADSCTQYASNLDVMTIIPRPISAFKKCAYVPSCRSKCQQEIDVFYQHKLGVASPNVLPIKSALLAFVPAWVSQLENLDEQFVPIAVQDYGRRELCDHYIVVIGRPVNHEQVLDAPWTMYIFCYLHETTSLAIMSKIQLLATRHFVLSRTELLDKQSADTENARFKLVSEILLPPLDDVNDRGAVVLVLWDEAGPATDDINTANHNGVFEVFVDSSDTVHAAWLMHSKLVDNDGVCANLHASVMASCGGRISDISLYNFVNSGLDSATIKKIAILPKQQPAQQPNQSDRRPIVYTIIGLLQVFVEYTVLGDDGPATMCTVDLEFTRPLYRSGRGNTRTSDVSGGGDGGPECHVNHPVDSAINTNNITVYSLLYHRILRKKEILLSSTERDTVLLISTGEQKIQRLHAFVDHSSGMPRLMFTVVRRDDITLDPLFLQNNKQRYTEYSRFDYNTIGSYVGVQLHDAAYSIQNRDSTENRIVYTVKESTMAMTSQVEGFIREYVFSVPSVSDMTLFRERGDGDTTGDPDAQPLGFVMTTGAGIAATMQVTVEEVCDYMNCKACRTRRLTAFCEAAQRCAVVNCVGTVLNPNNVLCVAGSLVKEVLEVYLSNVDAMWFGLVEIAMSVLRLAKVSGSRDVIMLESVSNVMNTALCETKDIYAALSAVLPSFVFSVYVAVAGKKQQKSILDIENPGESRIRQLFSPGTQLRNVAIVSSATQTIYQFALILLHLGDATSKLMLCTMDKFAEFSGGYIDVLDHDSELGKGDSTIDYCMSRIGARTGLRAFSDAELINDRVAIGAVDNNIVKVSIGGRRIRSSVFTIDTGKAIVWAKNYNYITWLIYVNAAFDSVLGILYGFSRIGSVVQNDECRPRPVEFSSILKCVCGDIAYIIHSQRRAQGVSTGALWCAGMLKMVNTDGDTVYVDNPFSLAELSTDLHRPAQTYIDCITVQSETACAEARAAVFLPKYTQYFDKHKVSPLAVLGQCRENYNGKTWDEGVFGLYNSVLQSEILRTGMSSLTRMQELRGQVDSYLNEEANGIIQACLAAGPLRNRIQACMQLTFTHHNQQQQQQLRQQRSDAVLLQDFSTAGYFMYDVATPQQNPDACEYLSSPSFLKNTDVQKCRSEDTTMDSADVNACGHTLLEREDTCRIGMSTLAYEQSIQTNIIDEFRVTNQEIYDEAKISAVEQTVQAKYGALAQCTAGYAALVEKEIMPNIRRIVDALDLILVSSEGDLIHQFVDCIMMGANTKAILAPADIGGVMENFMYSRHVNGTSRDFELPCHGSYVSSGESGPAGAPFRQKTCGSDTRIAVMAYATREILDKEDGGLHALVARLITDKVASITAALTNVKDYGCLHRATGLVWYDAGTESPVFGRELKSTLLRDTLASAQPPVITLTEMQWRNVNITDLRNDDFIRLGNIVYRQSLPVSWKHCCVIPGQCTPGESNFESNLPEIDTTVSIASIMTALTESMKSIEIDTITTRAVLTKYATNKTHQSIRDYNSMAFLAKHQDVSYAIDGEITYSARSNDADTQYEFPFTREKDPLSLIHQCHAIMRARTFSHPVAYVAESRHGANTSSTTLPANTHRKLVTLEAIMHYLESGMEWKPLNMESNASDHTHLSRPEIVRVINEHALHMPLNILYDSRFVSHDSHFCQADTPEPQVRKRTLSVPLSQADMRVQTMLGTLQTHVDEIMNPILYGNKYHLPFFGTGARTMGNIDLLCPCAQPTEQIASTVNSNASMPEHCVVSFGICQVARHETGSRRSFFESVFAGCTAEGRADSVDIVYRAEHRAYLRTLLREYNTLLKETGFVCDTMLPSDLWGLGVSQFRNSDQDVDVTRMLLHPKSGVSMLNYRYAMDNVPTVLSDGDRQVLLARENVADTEPPATTARNVLCKEDAVSEKRIAQLGFPVLAMLAESPAVMNCVRYVLEVSWKDILDEFVPLLPDTPDHIVALHVDAETGIGLWRDKCEVKLQKLATCHGQAAFSMDFIQSIAQDGQMKHRSSCPFTLAPELQGIASIMYGPCLLIFSGGKQDGVLCDPHLCTADRLQTPFPQQLQQQQQIMLRKQDVGYASDGTYSAVCEVFNPLSMLSLMNKEDTGVVDLPALSGLFVRSLVSPAGVVTPTSQVPSGSVRPGVRRSGILGTHRNSDFLFPSHTNVENAQQQHVPNNNASSQCFEAFAYWPQHWQAPFGEILHDTYEHVSAFGNYMALLAPEPDCADELACQDRLVLLPDHMRFENMTSNYFGTSGLCREHSFGMPLAPTNTHSVCTSNPSQRSDSGGAAAAGTSVENSDSFECETNNTESCSCSDTPRVSIGGGMGDTIGHLWPLLRAFLNTGGDPSLLYDFNVSTVTGGISMSELSAFVDLDLDIDLQAQDPDHISTVVREQCYGPEAYGNPLRNDTTIQCTYNDECENDGRVCNVMGQCVEMRIDIQNRLLSGGVEIGLNSPSCVHNQDSFSGASPWRRMHDILEQHGMCSHSNRVAYERMNDMFEALSPAESGCSSHHSAVGGLSYWTCDRSMVNWTWVRERPGFIPFPDDVDPTERHFDMRAAHVAHSILHDGLFDIAPHLCDSEYMHSHSLGWCGLQHHTPTPAVSPLPPQESARWMRTAPLHRQFSMLKPLQSDIDRRTGQYVEARDKLRFMGLHASMLQYKTVMTGKVLQNLAVQQCAALGVCQTEIFTAAGTPHNRMKPSQLAGTPLLNAATVKVSDMIQCGPMGYNSEATSTVFSGPVCILDRATAPIVYLLRDAQMYWQPVVTTGSTQSAMSQGSTCLDLYGMAWSQRSTLNLGTVGVDITYQGGSQANNRKLQMFLNSLIVLDLLPPTRDRVLVGNNIHSCVVAVADFLGHLPPLYTQPPRVQGLYIMLEFGSYEVPLFWWLKYSLSRVVFESKDAMQVTAAKLNSPRPVEIDAFQKRIAPSDVVPEGVLTDDTTLREFWSRVNVQELGLWSESHDFIVSELAKHIDNMMSVSAVMGCVTEFAADIDKILALRTAAKNEPSQHHTNRKIEKMLDNVFTHNTNTRIWAGIGSDETNNVDSKTLTATMQFSNAHLLTNTDGLDSILSFREDKFNQVDDAHGFIRTFLKRAFDLLIDTDQYNPMVHPEDQVVQIVDSENGIPRKGIKILDLNFEAILQSLKSSNGIRDYTAEFLGEYDQTFEDDATPAQLNAPPPRFTMGCAPQSTCVGHLKEHCIFDRNSREALLQQGESAQWNKLPANIQLYAGAETSAYHTIDMCARTQDKTLFGYTDPLTGRTPSSPQPVNDGGRCTLADLRDPETGAGQDYEPLPSSSLPPWKLMFGGGVSLDQAECVMAEDDKPPKLSSEPVVDTTDAGKAHFVGGQYIVSRSPRPTDRLCHRIDSGCVAPTKVQNAKLFPVHASKLRYAKLEANAHTQANGRMWHSAPTSRPPLFQTTDATAKYGDMYAQTLDIPSVFETSTDDIWKERAVSDPTLQCPLHKITWPIGLTVKTFVLNSAESALGSEASFSHVMYSDRVLQRRLYDDGTEQQLFAPHFYGGEDDIREGRQVTSPTPLMSYCNAAEDKPYATMHHFKRVDFTHVGKTRMYDRYHRFNQNIGVDADFQAISMNDTFANMKQFVMNRQTGTFADFKAKVKEFYDFWQDTKVSAHGMIGSGMFFNSIFRWTTAQTPNPTKLPTMLETCMLIPKRKELSFQTVWPTCRLGDNGAWQTWEEYEKEESPVLMSPFSWSIAPGYYNPWHRVFPSASIPMENAPWNAYTLAAYYEQDAYEESTIRPWWSSTVCSMLQNFADRSTNYHSLRLLFRNMPYNMYQLMGGYFDSGEGIHNTIKTSDQMSMNRGGSKIYMEAEYSRNDYAYVEGSYDSLSWRARMRFISDPKSVFDYYSDQKNIIYKEFADNNNLKSTNAFTQLMNLNLLVSTRLARVVSGNTPSKPTTLSFSSCENGGGRAMTGLRRLAHPYCDGMRTSTHRRITKPSLWAEVDGSPGKYLVACRPDETTAECFPILIPELSGTTAGVAATPMTAYQDNVWTRRPAQSGACSYSVEFESRNYFCDPLVVDTHGTIDHCLVGPSKDQHPKPVRGSANIMWKCDTCHKFSSTRPILTNRRSAPNSIMHEHRVGCGIYRRDKNQAGRKLSGPMTAAHRNYSELMDDVVQAMSGIFSDVADIENTLSNRLMPVFGDKIFIRDNALWWNAASVNNTQMHPKVVQQFSEFGLSEVQGCPLGIKRAATLDQQEAPVDCVFPVYDAVEAFENSILFRNDLDNGCMATDNGQDHLSKSTCDGSITKHTVDRIKEFTEHVHRATFGLELPVVQAGQTINTRVASGSRVSWIDGVLPFYAASDRGNEHVHDGDYLGYVLDNEARCKDSYKGKSLSQYACYLDSTGTVQLVVPWLGKNYSFLRAGNRLKILEYNFGDQGRDIPEQELFRVEMGTDMCLAPDRQTRVPCTATACIDEEYKTFQDATAFCASSNFADPYYRSEVPKKSNRIYVERLHQEQNLYNPDAPFSQCNIKFTPRDEEHARGKQCTHMQAPIGYSPSAVRLAVKGVSSLNRTRVQIAAARIVRHEFSASPTPVGHASLWAGEQLSLENTVEAVYGLLAVKRKQLAPARITLRIGAGGSFVVKDVHLKPDAGNPSAGWVSRMHQTVQDDMAEIRHNPLYTNACPAGGICHNRHWSCPFVQASLFGSSHKARQKNRHIFLITPGNPIPTKHAVLSVHALSCVFAPLPLSLTATTAHTDPVRMRRLYPDLGGAHPLLRSRNITVDDIQQYQQFGIGIFVNIQQHQHSKPVFHTHIRSLLDVFISRTATRTFLHTGQGPLVMPTTSMDWPHLRADLRSGESIPQGMGAPHDQRAKLPIFWISMKQLVMRNLSGIVHTANTVRAEGPLPYSGFQHTTLDAGGDCHRQAIIKVTAQELHRILAADVCFVTGGNDTFRHLNCTSRGSPRQTEIVLPTTSTHGIVNHSAFYGAKKLFRACGLEETRLGRAGNTKIYVWNAVKQEFQQNTTRDETSLSKRVRISPLWNMLARLKGVAREQDISAWHAWEKTDSRRHQNPRWAHNTDSADSLDPTWDTDWVFTNTDPQCNNKGFGNIPHVNWYNNPKKADTCLHIAQSFSRERGTCLKELANSFDICQIDELKDFCGAVQNIRTELRQVNAVANQYTNLHKNLYLPSRYLKQDGMFGWSAMVETYHTIDPALVSDTASCPGIAILLANAAVSYQENEKCPATWLFKTSNFLEKVRNIVSAAVTIIVIAQDLLVDGALFLLSVLAQDKGMMNEKVKAMMAGLRSLVVKLLDYYGAMLRLLWDTLTMQEGVFKSISDLLKQMCNFARKMTLLALDMAKKFLGALKRVLPFVNLGSAVRNLDNARVSVMAWNCDLLGQLLPDQERPATQLHASLCFIEQNGFQMPADALGGRFSEFSCGPTSFCLEEVLSTKPAKLCLLCRQDSNTLLRGFACDLTTSQCVCGERDLTSTKCATTEDCGLSSSVCDVQASFYAGSYTTQLCIDSPGRSYCVKRNMHDGVGVCTSFVNEPANLMPACQEPDLASQKWSFAEDKCLGYGRDLGVANLNVGVLMSETFVFPCLDIAALGQVFKLACIRIILDGSIQNSILSFLTYNILSTPAFGLGGRRRLLQSDGAAEDNYTARERGSSGSMLTVFVEQSKARVHKITGSCRRTLQMCVQPLSDSGCLWCARIWWFANFSLSTADPDTSANLAAVVSDTDLVDVRHMIVTLAHNPLTFARIVQRTPQAVAALVQDWLQDEVAYHVIIRHLRRLVQLVDDLVHGLMLSMLPSRSAIPTAVDRHLRARNLTSTDQILPLVPSATASRRRLLQVGVGSVRVVDGTVATSSVTVAPAVIRRQTISTGRTPPSELSRTRDSALQQLHQQMPFFDVSGFDRLFDDVATRNAQLPIDLATILTETFSDAFDSNNGTSCMVSFGTVHNDIIMNFARMLAKDGWTVKPVCTRAQLNTFSQSVPVCPILTAPFTRAYENTMVLAKYYAYMVQSTCLTNMSVSCQRPSINSETGIINALPRLSRDPKFTNRTMQDVAEEKDIISFYIIRFFYAMTDLISFDRSSLMASVMAFSSTDALYDEHVRITMVRNNEYSIGRLLHDYFNCDLEQTITCGRKNQSLLPVFAAVFIVLLILHIVLPIPSTPSFFIWTIGLTYGVVYMAYNFSPLCSPRIPTCIGHGIYELTQQIMPLRIQIPRTLYHTDKCNSDLTLKPEFQILQPDFVCGKTCVDAPYEMKDIITVLIASETWFRYDRAVFMEKILTDFNFLLPSSVTLDYIALIGKYAADVHKNADGYVLGFVACIFFNFYKLVCLFIVVTVFLPFSFNLVFSLFTFTGMLVLKYSFFAYNTDIYAQMH